MKKTNFVNRHISIFLNALKDIDALKVFYTRTVKSITEYKLRISQEYAYGIKLGEYFDEILEEETIETRNAKIDEVLERAFFDDLKVKDFCLIEKFTEDSKNLIYATAAKYRNDAKYSPTKAIQKMNNVEKNEHFLVCSILSNIIIIFESALSETYTQLILENPKEYLGEKNISVASFFNGTFKEELNNIIDEKVSADVYDSLKALSTIAQQETLTFERYEKFIAEFKEIYFRRNSYVHTDGRANKKYLANVDKKFTSKVKEGDLLVCDEIYIENAINVLTKLLFSITYEIIIKRSVSGKQINRIANSLFDRLKNKEYVITSVAYYALSQYKELKFIDRTMYRINYINSIKQLGMKEKAKKEAKELDVSIATDDFKIAKECLLDNNETVFKMLNDSYPNSYNAVSIKDWPIFINFRESKYYEEFVNAHQEDFAVEELGVDYNDDIEETED